MGCDDRHAVVRVIRNRGNVPVHAEVLAENGVVRLAWFAALQANGRWMKIMRRRANEKQRTRCLISFEKAKRRTASMRSRVSSWSLILYTAFNQRYKHRVASTHTSQRGPVCLGSANIQGLVLVRAMMQVARDA